MNLGTGKLTSDEVIRLRVIMGTLPEQHAALETPFYRGVEGIEVKLVDHSVNPYKAMVIMATSTWGKHLDKWSSLSLEGRLYVTLAVLERKTLPVPLEAPSFTFTVEGASRSAFDQLARARVGVGFASMGWRDNEHTDIGFRVPESIWQDHEKLENFKAVCHQAKGLYYRMVKDGQHSWQDARAILGISACHNFTMTINLLSLMGMCSQRLKFCEQADTVATTWLIREQVEGVFPLIAEFLRPGCDFAGRCQYREASALSEAFGCLFAPCGRNPDTSGSEYAQRNEACSDVDVMEDQLNMAIPRPGEWQVPSSLTELDLRDEDLLKEE